MLHLQKKEVERVRVEVSREIMAVVAPEYKKQIAIIAKRLIALNEALQDEAQMRDDLYQAGIPFTMFVRPMPIRALGTSRDSNSLLSMYLLECEEHGFSSANQSFPAI